MKAVLRLRRSRERRRSGLFVAEGRREVERALAAGLTPAAVYWAPELLPGWDGGGEQVTARVMARMAYRDEPEGVLAVLEAPERPLPPAPTLLLVAAGIEKPGNLGALARSAAAAGADGLLVAEAEADPWNPNAIRASTGAVFTLPVVETDLETVAALQLQRVAAVVDATLPFTSADLTPPTAILVGAEDTGLPEQWRAAADIQVSIPMRPGTVDSLNASVAAAVLIFEAVRQRA